MTSHNVNSSRAGVLRDLSTIGSRAAAATMRPLARPAGAAAGLGINLQRRAIDRLLDSGKLEHLLDSERFRALVGQLLESDGTKLLVDAVFDSGLFEHLVDRLLASDALWYLVDEIAGSPTVTAAISQQGLGFADQLGAVARRGSHRADDWLERSARRLIHLRSPGPEATA